MDEIQKKLHEGHGLTVSQSAISKMTKKLGFTRKRLRRAAGERDEMRREEWVSFVQDHLVPSMLVFVDESSKDNRTIYRHFGRAPAGTRAVRNVPFARGTRYSIVAALSIKGYVASEVVEGSVDSALFFKFITEEVVSVSSLSFTCSNCAR